MTRPKKIMRNPKHIIRISLLSLALAVVVLYGSYEFRNYFAGPSITITTPLPGVSEEQMLDIKGETRSIAHITLNGRPIFVDETGAFTETVVLLPGHNTMTIRAEDRFGNETEVVREVVYAGEMPAVLGESSDTEATTSLSAVEN